MGEVVAVAELAHDPAPPQLVDRRHDGVGVQVARLGEQVEGEVRARPPPPARPPPGRPRSPAPAGCAAPPRQSPAGSGRCRDARLADAAAHRLDDVQREAAGRGLEQAGVGLPRAAARRSPRPAWPCRRPPAGRGTARSAARWPASGRSRPPARGRRRPDVVAQRAGHQDRRASAARPRQKVTNASVSWSHHCRLSRTSSSRPADGDQRPGQALEEPVALPGVRHRPRRRVTPGAAGRHQPLDLGPPGRVEGRRGRPDGRVPQPVRHRGQRQPPRRRRSTGCSPPRAPCRPAIAAISATRRVFPTPAPPRTSTSPGCPAAAARHSGPQHAELARPADQLRAGRPSAGSGRGQAVPRASRSPRLARPAGRRARASAAGTPAASPGSGITPSSRSSTEAQWW